MDIYCIQVDRQVICLRIMTQHTLGIGWVSTWLLLCFCYSCFSYMFFTSGRDSYSLCSAPFLHAVIRWKGLVEIKICCFELHFCDKTLPFSKTEFRLKIPEVWVYVWWESQFTVESRSHEFIFVSVDLMFETLLQVMSNDGLKLLYVQLHRHLSTQFNNTGGEANLKKCMLFCLIQTSVTLAIIKASKGNWKKDSVSVDIWKEVDVEDFGSIISEQVAELNDFRKKDWNIKTIQSDIQFYIITQEFLEVISLISDFDKEERLKLIENQVPRQNHSRNCRWENADIKWMLMGWIEKMNVWIWKLQSFAFGFFSRGMMSIDTCPFEISNEREIVSISEHYLFGKASILRQSSIPFIFEFYIRYNSLALIRCSWIMQKALS